MTMHEYFADTKFTVDQIHRAILDFMRGRKDCVLIGAWAVNYYVDINDQRMTSDIDIISEDAKNISRLIVERLQEKFLLKVTSRLNGIVYQLFTDVGLGEQKIADVCAGLYPKHNKINGLCVVTLENLIEMKKEAIYQRGRTDRGLIDQADLMRLEAVLAKKPIEAEPLKKEKNAFSV